MKGFSLSCQYRSRVSTIRSAALPSHFGGITPFFHCPAINRAKAGGSLLGSVPMSSFVPMAMVSGRSVLSRRVFVTPLCVEVYSAPRPRLFSVDFSAVTDRHDGHQMPCVIHLVHDPKGPYPYTV